MRFEKLRLVVISVVFISIISFPLINDRLHFVSDIKNFENRALAPKPAFNYKNADQFPPAYELFYTDYFSLRFLMIRTFNIYNLVVFEKSPCPDYVIIGRDGWLFLTGEEFDSYDGKNPLTKQELLDFKKEFEYRRDFLKKRNSKFYLMITPVKAAIYPEKVPLEILKKSDKCQGEILVDYLKKNSSINLVDLYPVLKENKKNYRTYYSLDNHWTQMGAFFGVNQFLNQVQKDFPLVQPLSLTNYNILESEITTGNTVKIISGNIDIFHDVNYTVNSKLKTEVNDGKKSEYIPVKDFPYPSLYEEVKETKDSTKPKLLIISDSFGEYPFSLLAPCFKKTVKIWDNWEYKLNESIVESERPDIVLLIVHEKNLRHILKNASTSKL